MSKQITLPLGLNPNDVNIGDLSLVIGNTFNVNNIKTGDIRNILLGLGGVGNIKNLCRSSTINAWAAFKPTRNINIPSGLTLSGDNIVYDIPDDSTSYRLGDFAGYNHQAPSPSISPTNINIGYRNRSADPNQVLTRSINVSLPEFDIRMFDANASHIIAHSIHTSRSPDFEYVNSTSITNTHLTNKSLSVNYRVLTPNSGDIPFRVTIWVGNAFLNQLYRFPNGVLEGNIIDGGSPVDNSLSLSPEEFYPNTHQFTSSSFNVLTQSGVTWSSVSSESWISMPSQSGTGNGTVFFDLEEYSVSGVQFRGGYIVVETTGSYSGLITYFYIIQGSAGAFNQGYEGGGTGATAGCSPDLGPDNYVGCVATNLAQTYDVGT